MYTDNKAWFLRCFEAYVAYIIDIAMLSVDIFFFSSGCLVTYSYLKDKTNERLIKPIDCREKLTEFFIHTIKRFIRYVFIVFIHVNEERQCNKSEKILLL